MLTRYPAAIWTPDPTPNEGYDAYPAPNTVSGVVLHSMDGNYATGGRDNLINGGVSWHFSILRDGTVLQHYELDASCYQCGIAWRNRSTIGIEHEGYHSPSLGGPEPLTEAQIVASTTLVRWIALQGGGWVAQRGTTLFIHKDLGTSSCPGTRFDNILDRWLTPVPDTLPTNTNITPAPWDIGASRISWLKVAEVAGHEFKYNAGALQDILDAVTKGFNS